MDHLDLHRINVRVRESAAKLLRDETRRQSLERGCDVTLGEVLSQLIIEHLPPASERRK
jgi:hypothetical protein